MKRMSHYLSSKFQCRWGRCTHYLKITLFNFRWQGKIFKLWSFAFGLDSITFQLDGFLKFSVLDFFFWRPSKVPVQAPWGPETFSEKRNRATEFGEKNIHEIPLATFNGFQQHICRWPSFLNLRIYQCHRFSAVEITGSSRIKMSSLSVSGRQYSRSRDGSMLGSWTSACD